MKIKFILPLLAVLFAIVGALATPMTGQVAWFKPIGMPAEEGTIDDPDTSAPGVECTLEGSTQCFIGTRPAYNSEDGANAQSTEDLLKYSE